MTSSAPAPAPTAVTAATAAILAAADPLQSRIARLLLTDPRAAAALLTLPPTRLAQLSADQLAVLAARLRTHTVVAKSGVADVRQSFVVPSFSKHLAALKAAGALGGSGSGPAPSSGRMPSTEAPLALVRALVGEDAAASARLQQAVEAGASSLEGRASLSTVLEAADAAIDTDEAREAASAAAEAAGANDTLKAASMTRAQVQSAATAAAAALLDHMASEGASKAGKRAAAHAVAASRDRSKVQIIDLFSPKSTARTGTGGGAGYDSPAHTARSAAGVDGLSLGAHADRTPDDKALALARQTGSGLDALGMDRGRGAPNASTPLRALSPGFSVTAALRGAASMRTDSPAAAGVDQASGVLPTIAVAVARHMPAEAGALSASTLLVPYSSDVAGPNQRAYVGAAVASALPVQEDVDPLARPVEVPILSTTGDETGAGSPSDSTLPVSSQLVHVALQPLHQYVLDVLGQEGADHEAEEVSDLVASSTAHMAASSPQPSSAAPAASSTPRGVSVRGLMAAVQGRTIVPSPNPVGPASPISTLTVRDRALGAASVDAGRLEQALSHDLTTKVAELQQQLHLVRSRM